MIHLGYETGTGRAVSVPLAHMAVTGQTQQSGKTTTLEALIDRGNLRAVVFVTKPGEKSFSEGRRILPFFKEHADWEYVKALLEARRSESLSKWDGYLMRVCSRARTLQDVRNNVERELPKKKSARPSHYEVLAGYLDLIIPELERVPYTDKLDLQRGVNIMDLSGMSDDMQSMVIRSTIEQIHKRERNTVLVLPEAWKFIPEGGRSSVFQALQALIREGATNGNFVWIDAQDLAVVSKRILKSVSVWILGKQQEANEVARTINHLIEPLQIRPDMIKALGIGQFLICADSHPARRVYVQPRWLGELDALAIARGEESVETAQAIFRQKTREISIKQRLAPPRTDVASPEEIAAVTAPLADNFMRVAFGAPEGELDRVQSIVPRPTAEIDDALGTPAEWRAKHVGTGDNAGRSPNELQRGSGGDVGNSSVDLEKTEGEETMWKERAEKAEAEIVQLRADILDLRKLLNEYRETGNFPPNGTGAILADPLGKTITGHATDLTALPASVALREIKYDPATYDLNFIYDEIKRRALKERPVILQMLSTRPELSVAIESKIVEVDGASLRGGIALLLQHGFFLAPKNGNEVFKELQRIGRKVAKRTVYDELERIAEWGFLTSESQGYQATDLKVTVKK